MSVDTLLSRLDRVRQTGAYRWVASCPTRDDKNPSMTIRLLDDGRILMHDFGGSEVPEILDALGLDWSALFPEYTESQTKPMRRPFPAIDALRCIAFEALIVQCAAEAMRRGAPLSDIDHDRLGLAVERLQAAARRASA